MQFTIQDIINMVSTVGFPIVVSLFYMLKMNKAIENNTKALIILGAKIGVDITKEVE
jgi:hypothetical protein